MRPINAKTRDLTAALVRTVLLRQDLNSGVEAAAMALVLLSETLVKQVNEDAAPNEEPVELEAFLVALFESTLERRHQPDLRLVVDDAAPGGVSTLGPDMNEDDARLWALQSLGPMARVEDRKEAAPAPEYRYNVGRLGDVGTFWLGMGATWEEACRKAADRVSTPR